MEITKRTGKQRTPVVYAKKSVLISGGELDGQRMQRHEIADHFGLAKATIDKRCYNGVYKHVEKKEKRLFLVEGKMLTIAQILKLPDAPKLSRQAMRSRFDKGIPWNVPIIHQKQRTDREKRPKLLTHKEVIHVSWLSGRVPT